VTGPSQNPSDDPAQPSPGRRPSGSSSHAGLGRYESVVVSGGGRAPRRGSLIDWIVRHRWWLFGIIAIGLILGIYQRTRIKREHSQDGVILAAAARYGVEAALIKAVVWRESGFNPRVTGRSGEIGLMQLMPGTGGDWGRAERLKEFKPSHLYDPAWNSMAGAWYLRQQLHRFRSTDNPKVYALAAYNAGPVHALRWSKGAGATNSAIFLAQIDYPMTRDYVVSVLERYKRYREEFAVARR
jgi:soluble lytic murein transglycosylase